MPQQKVSISHLYSQTEDGEKWRIQVWKETRIAMLIKKKKSCIKISWVKPEIDRFSLSVAATACCCFFMLTSLLENRLGRFWLMICHSTPLDWQLDQFEIKIKVTKEYVKLEREMRDMKCRYILVIN